MSSTLLNNRYIVRVSAYDSAYPDNKATATVTIEVNRNPNPPIGPTNYAFTVASGAGVGLQVNGLL